MTTKRCVKCKLVKSTTEFYKHKTTKDGLDSRCKGCVQTYSAERIQSGLLILQALAMAQSCCAHCQREYTNEDWHFFEFDHINPNDKRSNNETASLWVLAHHHEFLERVAPNLQLLCVKCHKIKTSEESKIGGSVHQKMYGQSEPAKVIQCDLTLFDPSLTLEPGEEYSLHTREGEWITVRDIDGNLIQYEHRSNFLKQH